jgi:hypothetical protein
MFEFSAPHRPLSVVTPARRAAFWLLHQRMNKIPRALLAQNHRFIRIAYGRPASAASWALRIFDEATICMAFVICAVFLTDRMRLRMSRVLGMKTY